MKIEVLNRPAEEFESTWEGVTRKRVRQWAQLTVDGLATAFCLTHEPGKELPPGLYELDATSFGVSNGRLQLSRVVLKPIARAKAG